MSSASYKSGRIWLVFCFCNTFLYDAYGFTRLQTKVRAGRKLHTTTCIPSPLESSRPPKSSRCTNMRYLVEEKTRNGFQIPTFPKNKITSGEPQILMKRDTCESGKENEESENDRQEQEASADEDQYEDDGEMYQTAAQKRRDMVTRAALLGRGNRSRSPPSSRVGKEKQTSVGARRTGSATRAKQQPGSASKLMDALRKAARGASAEEKGDQQDDETQNSSMSFSGETPTNGHSSTNGSINGSSQLGKVSSLDIHSAIGDLLDLNYSKNANLQTGRFQAAVSSLKKSVGISDEPSCMNRPAMSAPLKISTDGIFTRLANAMDDLDIANLRLSVFSGFTFDQQGQFCARSCQAIANRRKRGAVCFVATKGADASPRIYGTAECSFHEFHGTQLGQRRPRSSIIYVTEVAVHPAVRRKGIGSMLLESIDIYAERRRIETVYLHVDVCNEGALGLYRKCGYREVDPSQPIFEEFTKSLNLHPGATKGRNHHLLFKDICQATWLPHDMFVNEPHRVVGQLGFEIPA